MGTKGRERKTHLSDGESGNSRAPQHPSLSSQRQPNFHILEDIVKQTVHPDRRCEEDLHDNYRLKLAGKYFVYGRPRDCVEV